jgi:hypothetical protein
LNGAIKKQQSEILALQRDNGFGCGLVLFAIGAGDITERGVVDGRAEFGEGNFALSEINTSRTIEADLVAQGIFGGLARMLGQLQRLNDVAENRPVLTEGGAGNEEDK